MKTIITILSISTVLLSFTSIAKAQSNNFLIKVTISGDSLKTVEDRSINHDNYRKYIDKSASNNPPNGIQLYELRRPQENVEVIPGVSIPFNRNKPLLENLLKENVLEGDKSGKGFKIKIGI